jgi:biopolymer transport protein ExbD
MTVPNQPFPQAGIDPPLSCAQRSRIRRLAAPKEPEVGEEAGELNIVPYLDIITNVLVFVLASVTVTFLTQLDTVPPSLGSGKVKQDIKSDALNLTVLVAANGVAFTTSFGGIATGCNGVGQGITVPKKSDGGDDIYDVKAVRACARTLKYEAGGGKFEDEQQVTVACDRNVQYKYLIQVLDALRSDPDTQVESQRVLFPEFHLGVAK